MLLAVACFLISGSSYTVCMPIQLCLTLCNPWTTAQQALLEFSRQEYWSGLLFPTPGDLPNPRIKPMSLRLLHSQADSLPLDQLGNVGPKLVKDL